MYDSVLGRLFSYETLAIPGKSGKNGVSTACDNHSVSLRAESTSCLVFDAMPASLPDDTYVVCKDSQALGVKIAAGHTSHKGYEGVLGREMDEMQWGAASRACGHFPNIVGDGTYSIVLR